jgi:hypothetical protein
MNRGILFVQLLEIFFAFELEHRSDYGHAGVAAGKADLALQLGPQQTIIVFWNQVGWYRILVISQTDVRLAIDRPVH